MRSQIQTGLPLFLLCDLTSSPQLLLFSIVDTLQVLRGDVGAQQRFPSIFSVALQNLPLKVGTHWTNFISLELGVDLICCLVIVLIGYFVELGTPFFQLGHLFSVESVLLPELFVSLL